MKTITGFVTSDKMTKTVVVSVDRLKAHPMYHKRMRKTKKFHAHDETGARTGDTVEMKEIRPMSKTKFWEVVKILVQKEKPVEIAKPVAAVEQKAEKPAAKTKKTTTAVKPVKKAVKK